MDIVKRQFSEGDWISICREPFRNKNLSLKARGLLITIMSLKSDWDFSVKGICSILKEGKDAVYGAIKELEEQGYCQRKEVRDSKGKIASMEYVFADYRLSNPQTENPYTDNPDTENPPQYNNRTNITPKKNEKGELKFPYNSEEFMGWWKKVCSLKKWKNKETSQLQFSLDKLAKVSEWDAIEAMKLTFENNWQGVFPKVTRQPLTPQITTITNNSNSSRNAADLFK